MGRVRLLPVIILAAALVVGGVALAQSLRSPSHASVNASPNRRDVAIALGRHLHQRDLSYRWVVCIPMNRRYAGQRLYRCNVDFGDPHIVPYCAVVLKGKLVTDYDNARLNCGARVQFDEKDKSVYVR